MRKIILFIGCSFLAGYCFSQLSNSVNTDSSNTRVQTMYSRKEAIKNTLAPELVIYPNPAKNKITIQVKHFTPGMAAVKIMDTKGKLVRTEKRLLTNGEEDIIMFLMLKPGMYFILVTEPGKTARKKIVML